MRGATALAESTAKLCFIISSNINIWRNNETYGRQKVSADMGRSLKISVDKIAL